MTKLQKSLIVATLAAAVGTGIYEARQAAQVREQNQKLIAQQEQLARERDTALSDTAAKEEELDRLRKDKNELLRLRGQVATLRQTAQENARLKAEQDSLAMRLQQSPIESHAAQPEVRLSGISFKGNTRFTEAELAGILVSRVGEGLDQQKLDTDVTEIWKKYRDAGYSDVPVRAVKETDKQSGQTTVTFVVGDTLPK